MDYISIHGTNLRPSRVGLATSAIGARGDAMGIATIHRALDAGISLIETSPAYGHGRTEELIGRALTGRREHAIVVTNASAGTSDIRKDLDHSLHRLKTDYVDVYQVHWPDWEMRIEEIATDLRSLYEGGKIKAIGVGNLTPKQMDWFRRFAPLHAISTGYDLFTREAEHELLPYARTHLLCAITFAPHHSGRWGDQHFRAVVQLSDLARQRFGKRVAHLRLRWTLDASTSAIALCEASAPEDLVTIEESLGFTIDPETRREIDSIAA